MKSVLLNNAGHTADGQWRLTPVEPDQSMIDAARDKYMAWHYGCGKEDVPLYYTPSDHFRAMIAASPAPELGEATDNRIAELEAENQALRVACISIFNDYVEWEVRKLPPATQDAWEIGKEYVEKELKGEGL